MDENVLLQSRNQLPRSACLSRHSALTEVKWNMSENTRSGCVHRVRVDVFFVMI